MPLALLIVLAAAVPDEVVVTAMPRPLPGPVVPDAQLNRMRGGLRLPNGLDLALGIDIQTRVDGMLALHTVYASEGANPGVRVYTDGAKPVPTAPTNQTIDAGPVVGVPVVVVDRSPTGPTIVPTSATPATTVNLVHGDPSTWLSGAGQTQVPVVENGPAVAAPPGQISLASNATGAVVTLQSPTLEVQQLIGQASGVIVANTANDRVIDTTSAVNVDLRGFAAELLAGTFQVQRAVLDAVITR